MATLNETLDRARFQDAKRRKNLILGLSVAVILCGVLIVGISFPDFFATSLYSSSYQASSPHSSSPRAIPKQAEKLPVITDESAREQFKERLGQYENGMEPRLQTANLAAWNRDASFEIRDLKRQSIAHFQAGDYTSALAGIQELEGKTAVVLVEKGRIFQEESDKAIVALDNLQYEEARLHIEKALSVDPESLDAIDIQRKIEALPGILPLLEAAKVARSENNIQKEHDLLRQVLQMAPDRQEVVSRVGELSRILADRAFGKHISDGLSNIGKRQAREARHHYEAARKIYPSRQEVSSLLEQLLTLEKSIRVERAIRHANDAIRRDDWRKAKRYFSQAEKDAPDDGRVVSGLKRTGEILFLKKNLAQYAADPYRLNSNNIRSRVETLLSRANAVSEYSFSLRQQAEKIADLIVKINTKVPVYVISDNKTYVQVRGVGKVGTVSRKKIRIKPGRYTFEGMRDGFRSKLIKVTVPYDRTDFSIQVICDEPIR
uniref:Tetratricopeptide repeat n=1 Tax=Candidatus Kentrum sp. TUN TaxID=2126343 RepID=A0A450ZI14_9GAMM|nr:MAG: Tetratricopeptide repeat [Candidatus Kentron sp. TUN]VFK54651.1 MAG: Tetratricopeptide repeat [Candidatus Kentron sp. TUN]